MCFDAALPDYLAEVINKEKDGLPLIESTTTRILASVAEWLAGDQEFWFVTVLKTWGASPLPAGSWLAWQSEQGVVGAVSGGCIESDLERKIRQNAFHGQGPWLVSYGGAEAERLGLPCGGQVELLIERHSPDNASRWSYEKVQFANLTEAADRRQSFIRRIQLADPSQQIKLLENDIFTFKNNTITHHIKVNWQLLLIGASELSRCVASLAAMLSLPCFVWEPRVSFRKSWPQQMATILSGPLDSVIKKKFSDPKSAIMALAHEPQLDDLALLAALETRCGYIGALGSQRTQQKRFARLKKYADNPANLNRIHAPIGLDIGSKTPVEIAVSVCAQLIQVMRKDIKTLAS